MLMAGVKAGALQPLIIAFHMKRWRWRLRKVSGPVKPVESPLARLESLRELQSMGKAEQPCQGL